MSGMFSKVWMLPVYALFIYTWLLTGFGKLFGTGVPAYFSEKFGATFLASFPGISVAYYQIALFEAAAGLIFVASLLKGEFFPQAKKTLFLWGIWMSQVTFAMLGFGLRLTSDHAGAANIFFYMGATAVLGWVATRPEES